MAVPTSYTEETLQAFMLDAVGNLADVLELTADDFNEAVNDTLLAYGVDTVEGADQMKKLRALARVEAWRVAVRKAAGRYNFQSASARYERRDIYNQAADGLSLARWDASVYVEDDNNAVGLVTMTYADDPYVVEDDEDAQQG